MTLNLVRDAWLPVLKRDGSIVTICPAEISSADIVNLAIPSAPLALAAHEFLIGLLSTCATPTDEEAWQKWWEDPPSTSELERLLEPFVPYFNLIGEGRLFCQDLDMDEPDEQPIGFILIDAPGENTIKENKARTSDLVAELTLPEAALALYCLQSRASFNGIGQHGGLRNVSGALSTFVVAGKTLWGRIWPSVETAEQISSRYIGGGSAPEDIFSWLTAWSDEQLAPTDRHPLHVYWPGPRRLKLLVDADGKVRRYLRQGTSRGRYAPGWQHPLSPYRDVGTEKQRPEKASQAPSCRDWVGIVYRDPDGKITPASALSKVIGDRAYAVDLGSMRLFAGGFSNNQSLVEGYIEGEQPLVIGHTRSAAQRIEQTAARLVLSARVVETDLIYRIKDGLGLSYGRGAYKKVGETLAAAKSSFWSGIDAPLRELLAETGARDDIDVQEESRRWVRALEAAAREVFEDHVQMDPTAANAAAAVRAMNLLGRTLRGHGKSGGELYGKLLLPIPESRAKENAA